MDSSNRVKPQNLRTSTDAGMQSTAHEEKGGEIIETEVGEGAELMKTEEGEGEGEELLKTEEEDDDPVSEMPCIAKDITLANEAKEEGNNFFRTKDFDSAISSYSRAITLCPIGDDYKEVLSVFLGNRAAAYFSVDEFDCVVDDCTASLELNSNYVKVLMRRSQAYEKLTRPEDALVGTCKMTAIDQPIYKHNFFATFILLPSNVAHFDEQR
jgi:tetratricopeptide (TPR) repeat protein